MSEDLQTQTEKLLAEIKKRLDTTLNVKFPRDTLEYSYSKLFTLKTTDITLPVKPQITLENPYSKDVSISEISFVFDEAFQKKGNLRIEINGVTVFENQKKGDFDGIQQISLPFSQFRRKLKRDGHISIIAWNGENSEQITATVMISIGD